MKNLKIPEKVHDELKVFAAKEKNSMSDIGGFAIVSYMAEMGHKFIHGKPKSKHKPSKAKQ